MKIAFLSRYHGEVFRGAETYVQELSTRLRKLGHEVKIHKNIFDSVDNQTQIIVSTNGRLDNLLCRIWCLLHGAKIIISGQSGIGIDDKINLWSFPDTFVGLTDYQCQWAQKINPFVKTIKIPNGVDLQKFNPQIKPRKIDLKKPIVLNVGAVTLFKRQDLLVKATQRLGYSVLLVGKDGNLAVAHKDIPNIYTACDLFCYPTSPRESFGIAMVEAMASGLPVVATDDPIRREIVGQAGLFVDPTNIDDFSQKIDLALNKKWGNLPRQQAEKFSWDKIALDYDKLFNKLWSQS